MSNNNLLSHRHYKKSREINTWRGGSSGSYRKLEMLYYTAQCMPASLILRFVSITII